MLTGELLDSLDLFFPPGLQEQYDNTGGQIVFRENGITGILLALDAAPELVSEALELGCNCIVTHHPFFFKPVRRIDSSDPHSAVILECIANRISLYAAHTNLDKVFCRKLGEALGFENTGVLFRAENELNGNEIGLGTVAAIRPPMKMKELLAHVKRSLELDFCFYAGNEDDEIRKVALLNGSGGGSIEKIIKSEKVDCIITGDVTYHGVKHAIEHGVAVIDAGHYGTERVLLKFLEQAVRDCLTNADTGNHAPVYISRREENPIRVFL